MQNIWLISNMLYPASASFNSIMYFMTRNAVFNTYTTNDTKITQGP